jgi:hypothetical protein
MARNLDLTYSKLNGPKYWFLALQRKWNRWLHPGRPKRPDLWTWPSRSFSGRSPSHYAHGTARGVPCLGWFPMVEICDLYSASRGLKFYARHHRSWTLEPMSTTGTTRALEGKIKKPLPLRTRFLARIEDEFISEPLTFWELHTFATWQGISGCPIHIPKSIQWRKSNRSVTAEKCTRTFYLPSHWASPWPQLWPVPKVGTNVRLINIYYLCTCLSVLLLGAKQRDCTYPVPFLFISLYLNYLSLAGATGFTCCKSIPYPSPV